MYVAHIIFLLDVISLRMPASNLVPWIPVHPSVIPKHVCALHEGTEEAPAYQASVWWKAHMYDYGPTC